MKITVFLLLLLAAVNCIHSEPIKVIENKAQSSVGLVNDVKNLKRDQTEQTASPDNKSQSNSQQYYQQDQQQYYQTGFSPISNNQGQQYGKSEGGVEYTKSGGPQYSEQYQNPISNYQTIAYSANQPSHAKLPSVVQLDQHQAQQIQYTYPAATNQHQYSIVPQQRHLLRQQLVSIPHPYRHPAPHPYPQAHLGYLTHVPFVPQQSYIYPTHAIQYSIVAPDSENHQASTIAPSEAPKSQPTTVTAAAPVQYIKYPIGHLANSQPKLIYTGHVPQQLHYHHQPAAYDVAVQPAVQYIQPSKQYYSAVPSALQYKHILSGPIVHQNGGSGGASSYSKYAALQPVATTAASFTSVPVKPEQNIVFTTSSPAMGQHQQHPSDHISGPSKTYTSPGGQEAVVYSHPGATYYGTHLYHPSIAHKVMSGGPPLQFSVSKY